MYIRPEVRKFAEAMETQLRWNNWKGGWKYMSPGDLLFRAEEELGEVKECDGDSELLGEAADVANFLMMVCDVKGVLTSNGKENLIGQLKRKSGDLMRAGEMGAAIKLYNKAWEKERKRG